MVGFEWGGKKKGEPDVKVPNELETPGLTSCQRIFCQIV